MSFHVSLLGPVSGQIQHCSDLDGWVPEPGDRWQNFRWDLRIRRQLSDPLQGAGLWERLVAHAQSATQAAVETLLILEERVARSR